MSSKAVELDENLITNCLKSQEWDQLVKCLNEKFKITINSTTGEPVPLPVTESIVNILSCVLKELLNNDTALVATKQAFRSLRNCVVSNFGGQMLIAEDAFILCGTHSALDNLLKLDSNDAHECLVMALQFLSNLVAKNPSNALKVWEKCSAVILRLYKIPKYSYHTAALLYNVLYLKTDLVSSCGDIYEQVVEQCSDGNVNEYDVFLLELFVQNQKFFSLYHLFKPVHRMTALALIIESDLASKVDSFPCSDVFQVLIQEFKKKSDCILKTVANYVDQIEPEEVVLLLEILAKLSANERHRKYLQCDKGLLINCAFLLRSIHSLGKESLNNFTAISKLSEVNSTDSAVNKDPAFGFKANLVRLLGNLCWKHRENQDQARELDCIPLLLDCCNIDARNPFITQWIILAVRSLCENNRENQAVIAAMNQQGVVDSATLHEMGLTLHDDGTNKIGILPLDSFKK